MPIPSPRKNEDHKKFMGRCMSDPVMLKEYPDSKQRAAICYAQTRQKKKANAFARFISWLSGDEN